MQQSAPAANFKVMNANLEIPSTTDLDALLNDASSFVGTATRLSIEAASDLDERGFKELDEHDLLARINAMTALLRLSQGMIAAAHKLHFAKQH